jgi:hypothetical protein
MIWVMAKPLLLAKPGVPEPCAVPFQFEVDGSVWEGG